MADIFDLFGDDPRAAAMQAQALADAMRRRKAAGTLQTIVGGPYAAAGNALLGDAARTQADIMDAGKFQAGANLRRQLAQSQGAVGGTGKPQGMTLYGRVQFKTDPGTGETFMMDSDSGATYHPDGTPRTPPIRVRPQPGAVPPPAVPQPQAAAPAPVAPRLVNPKKPSKMDSGDGIPSAGPPDYGMPQGESTGQVGQPLYGKVLQGALTALGNDFDPNKGTGEVAANQKRLNAALRLKALVTNPDGTVKDHIPPQFMRETAAALAQMVNSGGVPAQSLIEELTPRTGSSKVADIIQYITSNPTDAGQGKFVELYLESANREAEVARKALEKATSARVGKHARVIKGNPKDAASVLQPYGWTLDAQGNLKPVEEAPTGGQEGATKVRKFQRVNGKLVEVQP